MAAPPRQTTLPSMPRGKGVLGPPAAVFRLSQSVALRGRRLGWRWRALPGAVPRRAPPGGERPWAAGGDPSPRHASLPARQAAAMEEEGMEEEGGSGGCEAMMDDQNHNNWGAGDYGRHLLGPAAAPLGDRLLHGPAAGPTAGTELPAVPEANGVLRGCEPGKGGAGAIAAAININASTSKFRE